MNITTVSTNTNFNGKILTTGSGWNRKLTRAFKENPAIKSLAKGEQDVIGHLHTKRASNRDFNHAKGEKIHRLDIELGDSKFPFINKIKSYMGLLPKLKFNKNYHRSDSIMHKLNRLEQADADALKDSIFA